MSKKIKCRICGERFEKTRVNRAFCSIRCRQKAWREKQPPVVHDFSCERCGAVFQSRRTIARFCCTRCRVAAHRAGK